MSKAFIKETDEDEELERSELTLSAGQKNYITPEGFARLQQELKTLLEEERPKIVEIVHWAAANGDRSENGDYIYGKKRLREIDRRVHFLIKRLEIAEIVDSSVHQGGERVFFGAMVTYATKDSEERSVRIVGVDEVEHLKGEVSWISPIAKALLRAQVGDEVPLHTPHGVEMVEIVNVQYPDSAKN